MVVLSMKGSDKIPLAILAGSQWIGFILHLSILLIHSSNTYFKWSATVSEVPAIGIVIWWINTILIRRENLVNQTNRYFQVTLATIAICTSCLSFLLRPEIETTDDFGNLVMSEEPNVFQKFIMNRFKKTQISQLEEGHNSIENTSKDKLIADSSSQTAASYMLNIPNQTILPTTPPPSKHARGVSFDKGIHKHTPFILPSLPPITFPTFTEIENDVHSLNIPQISSSPIRKSASFNSFIPNTLEEDRVDLVNIEHDNNNEDQYNHTNDILNSYAELDDDDDDDDDLYDTLNKEIKSNISIVRHQTSVPNLPSEMTSQRSQIVRHSRSYSLINTNTSINGKHSRSSSHSPIKKLGKSFKDSFSIEDSSNTFNFHHNNNNNNIQNQNSDEFELNMDLVKSIQKSPKKKRSFNHSRLPSINEPIKNPILLSLDNSTNSQEKRVISNSSIPDGYFSAYDREKWQAIKNMS